MFVDGYASDQRISSFMIGVYGWMSCALAITASAAYYVANVPAIFAYIQQPWIIMTLLCMQLAFVFGLSFFLNKVSYGTALILFLLYSFSLGITLSALFFVYTHASIIAAFLSTALMFAAMSFYGYVTKADLTTIGSMSGMALIGLIIAMIVNMFLKSEQFDYILSAIGILIFVLLTAYDTQKIKEIARNFLAHNEAIEKITIFGALTLYLDFINLFLFLLRFVGKRNER